MEGGSLSRLPGLIREARDLEAIRKDASSRGPKTDERGGSGSGGRRPGGKSGGSSGSSGGEKA